jgi:hypothetical protein
MKKGTNVSLIAFGQWFHGVTIENEAGVVDSAKRVIRVRWADGSETIENINDLIL